MLDFMRSVGALKALPRQGWVDRGILNPESVADHSYRAALMAWLLGQQAGLDAERLLKIMLLHDLPEAIVGDSTPYGPMLEAGVNVAEAVSTWRKRLTPDEIAVARQVKHRREAEGLSQMIGSLPQTCADELAVLWHEYAEGHSPEARFASQIDKLEALLQAIEYRQQGLPADVENFLLSARDQIEHPVLRQFLSEVEDLI